MAAPAPQIVAFAVGNPFSRADLPGRCALLERRRAAVLVCDVSGVGPEAEAVEALARLQLAARRHGCEVRLRRASPELLELVAFMGLRDVLPDWRDR